MRKEKILKILIALILGITLFTMTTNVFALDDDDSDSLNSSMFEDKTNKLNGNTNNNNSNTNLTNNNTNISNSDSNTNALNTNTSDTGSNANNSNVNNYNTNLPNAGAPENTIMGVAITVLSITAIYAYKKVKEYKNI